MRPTLQIDPRSLSPELVLEWPETPSFDPQELFPTRAPLHLEIGCGKGQWLLEAASGSPTQNFLGIEVKDRLVRFIADRLRRAGIKNARVKHDDIWAFLHFRLPAGCLSGAHLYFPDPWWKRKHTPRRVYTPELFRVLADALLPGGELHVATDVPRVFRDILAAVEAGSPCLQRIQVDSVGGDGIETNFQRKAYEEGRGVERARWVKPAIDRSPDRPHPSNGESEDRPGFL